MVRFSCFSVLLLISSVTYAQSDVYRWVNEDGVEVFSDQPITGATSVDLSTKAINIVESTKPSTNAISAQKEVQKEIAMLKIESPNHKATIRNATGELIVTASTTLPVGVTQRLELFLDGVSVSEPQSGTNFKLTGIERGEHQLQLKLVNNQGSLLSESSTVTFYMHRPSAQRKPIATPTPTN
ncbi:DUF4124 domain-containing protein [Echinimonas agarilytica]|uniref:DUF4124 domain-containing protein n=1 Tax=Echinimonas agarilytica TaxID=1215918 RepID=A0AA41W8M0_9GAMM|nr:DUF4124 domain-containing protein [Echinimonas agarilytica]MCM2681020.1 DUF4124 domain-containing protein [Echinimonas agarilytica]